MRFIMLLLSSLSFLCWATLLVSIFVFGVQPPVFYLQIGLFAFSLWWPKFHHGFQHNLYALRHKTFLQEIGCDDWVPAEFEIEGTENKLHIVPDDFGIIAKKIGKIIIINSEGHSTPIEPTMCIVLARTGRYTSSVSLINKQTRKRVYKMSITPYYKGSDLEIAAYPKKKVEWFARWIGSELEISSN